MNNTDTWGASDLCWPLKAFGVGSELPKQCPGYLVAGLAAIGTDPGFWEGTVWGFPLGSFRFSFPENQQVILRPQAWEPGGNQPHPLHALHPTA